MSSTGGLRSIWLKWKSLKLPWRRQWLVGQDLTGNTFWEFKNPLHPGRPRRIAKYPIGTHHGDVRLTPAWIQWLRYTRPEAPSIEEQQMEVQRQLQMKQLARLADQRWEEKPSFLDSPDDTGQVHPVTLPRDPGGYVGQTEEEGKEGVRSAAGNQEGVAQSLQYGVESSDEGRFKGRTKEQGRSTEYKADPWEQQSRAPGQDGQPESWSPPKVSRR